MSQKPGRQWSFVTDNRIMIKYAGQVSADVIDEVHSGYLPGRFQAETIVEREAPWVYVIDCPS